MFQLNCNAYINLEHPVYTMRNDGKRCLAPSKGIAAGPFKLGSASATKNRIQLPLPLTLTAYGLVKFAMSRYATERKALPVAQLNLALPVYTKRTTERSKSGLK